MSDPIVELEIRVAFQDKIISDLDEVVRAFAARVEQLERRIAALEERLDSAGELPVGPHDDPPPHY